MALTKSRCNFNNLFLVSIPCFYLLSLIPNPIPLCPHSTLASPSSPPFLPYFQPWLKFWVFWTNKIMNKLYNIPKRLLCISNGCNKNNNGKIIELAMMIIILILTRKNQHVLNFNRKSFCFTFQTKFLNKTLKCCLNWRRTPWVGWFVENWYNKWSLLFSIYLKQLIFQRKEQKKLDYVYLFYELISYI